MSYSKEINETSIRQLQITHVELKLYSDDCSESTRFLRLGVYTHDAAAVTPFCVIAVPRPVRVEHLAQEELVLLLVCLRALQKRIDIKAAVDTYLAWLSRSFEQ
jgi:hypothetical protein